MNAALYTPLPHRAFAAVRGEDRYTFLQGLVSNDLGRVEADGAAWAAFLTPQGKFLHEFFMFGHEGAVWLECELARRDDLVTRLARYKLRAKVTVAADDSLVPGVAWGSGTLAELGLGDTAGAKTPLDDGVAYVDPRLDTAGARWALASDRADGVLAARGFAKATPADYDAHRFNFGLPDGSRDMDVEKALLLENGFAELHGVDFQKGCYIGQELTARTHYRALIKRRLMPVVIEGPTPPPGTPLSLSGEDAGEMKSAAGGRGLALVRLETWRKAPSGVLEAGSTQVTPRKPDWMTFPE